jgi:uncharacterized integral membrane protein (TIGR00698 family)
MKNHLFVRFAPGLMVTAAIAVLSVRAGRHPWMLSHGFNPLTLAIITGMLLGNTLYPAFAAACGPGVGFSRQWLLRTGVVLYGLRLTVQDIARVGVSGVTVDAIMVASTFFLALALGVRWLGLDRKTSLLIAMGNAICGAAAIMAAEPVVKGRAEQVAGAIATVVVFGTLAMFIYPILAGAAHHFPLLPQTPEGFGIYIGSSVHEVAQVIAAARPVGIDASDTAVITKMVRVMMLAPMLLALSWWLVREENTLTTDRRDHRKAKVNIPWFVLTFIGAVGVHSLGILPVTWVDTLNIIDTDLLAMAMGALGVSTHFSSLRQAGIKPLVLAAALFVWLVVGGALVNHWVLGTLGVFSGPGKFAS